MSAPMCQHEEYVVSAEYNLYNRDLYLFVSKSLVVPVAFFLMVKHSLAVKHSLTMKQYFPPFS